MHRKSTPRALLAAALALFAATAQTATGLTELPGREGDGPVTVFYPSDAPAQPVVRGPFTLQLAPRAAPVKGNGRLIVLSHGSGGAPWSHSDLARALADAGFVVAMPEHKGDNYKDHDLVGPESWKRRPHEVSRAIDAVATDARFGPLLRLDKVGMEGMSAGGHTALALAGGRWSPSRLKAHCEAHIGDDFPTCVGLASSLTGGLLDGVRKTIALAIVRSRLDDNAWYSHSDKRIAAVVAGVPFAVDFDPASLTKPPVPLGFVTARGDKWLNPKFHSDPVVAGCASCEKIADFAKGGHGALLSPLPPGATELLGEYINDPPGFDRTETAVVDQKIVAFFKKHLLP
jgi:predicted dienelactone hydrolase